MQVQDEEEEEEQEQEEKDEKRARALPASGQDTSILSRAVPITGHSSLACILPLLRPLLGDEFPRRTASA